MINFDTRLEFNNKNYRTNVTIKDDNYKVKFLFTMGDFMLFGRFTKNILTSTILLNIGLMASM